MCLLGSACTKAIIPFSCAYEAETDTYRATVTIKSNSEVGIWTVDFIRTVDKARNEKVYGHQNALVAEAAFEVTGKP